MRFDGNKLRMWEIWILMSRIAFGSSKIIFQFFSQSESRCSTSKFSLSLSFSLSKRILMFKIQFHFYLYLFSIFFSQSESGCSTSKFHLFFTFFPLKANLDIQHPIPFFFFSFPFFLFFFNMKSECAIFKFLTLSLSLYEKIMKALFILSFLLSRRALDNTKRNTIRNLCLCVWHTHTQNVNEHSRHG